MFFERNKAIDVRLNPSLLAPTNVDGRIYLSTLFFLTSIHVLKGVEVIIRAGRAAGQLGVAHNDTAPLASDTLRSSASAPSTLGLAITVFFGSSTRCVAPRFSFLAVASAHEGTEGDEQLKRTDVINNSTAERISRTVTAHPLVPRMQL